MPCRIYLRRDQSLSLRNLYSSDQVCIFAPLWVKVALKILGKHLDQTIFYLYDNPDHNYLQSHNAPAETITITEDFNDTSLILLQKVARNEAANVTGVINKTLYSDINDRKVLYSLRDLVRQCVIAGRDNCLACGGYKCPSEILTKHPVYICDLAALQFQQPYNTGRLVLVQEVENHTGILDDFIFENVVGEKKLLHADILKRLNDGDVETKQRYVAHDGYGLPGKRSCFIDTKAYRKFVALDVVLSAIALCEVASLSSPEDKLHFKFLKYGTGFFAWRFQSELERLILPGVLDGLERLFGMEKLKVLDRIKHIELPFFKSDPKSAKRIEQLNSKYGVEIDLTTNDALRPSPTCAGSIVATTNCGDNHAVCGNEMNFSSVDAAIAENLESKGNLFCPNINLSMRERYLDL